MSLRNTVDLFVPGRLCLFGEHSDWAGEYRRKDPGVEKGFCIIAGTDQGIHVSAEPLENGFRVCQVLPDGSMSAEVLYLNTDEALQAAKESGCFHAYIAGTASVIMKEYPGRGIRLRVYRRTLPLKKGLSSSAAVCVAAARACSRVHRLGFSIPVEMDIAYRGELLTGSHCGRMDQACAWGKDPVMLTFDGDEMCMEKLCTGKSLHMIIADLGGKKDTKRILKDLNECFASGNTDIRRALGEENRLITERARASMESGDADELGKLMTLAQEVFDKMVAPCCPAELKSPKLHHVLNFADSSGLSLGGKGVGSQGDGTAQFLCRGEDEREKLAMLLETIPGVRCYYLTI